MTYRQMSLARLKGECKRLLKHLLAYPFDTAAASQVEFARLELERRGEVAHWHQVRRTVAEEARRVAVSKAIAKAS